ncbi:two component, sigma54 specific, transcriptional regulator, Fis family protein [Plesiocystis pacifica SIR-1]|uniref:Two component, sigma54 specific, transcriptional regulator, Fis family protein n=1 Tax=Plesiocystis pacifica SIR-1 TaxID=391625 RepID=A6G687_9BACT|nr:sigma-54 dependent transcriptional regulator [Plesiocystis pacifica]EDM78689.1 two component, sigma54 specific, transcriptional regulator, Fis family protein [Plesiocystis pacifica SIR-1]
MTEPKPRVLVVDDEPNLRKVLGALLMQLGYEVLTEPDGASALARVKSAPRGTFDVVISDLRMPNMDGMALLEALTAEDSSLPVIILTAHGTVDTAVQAVKKGAFDFLEKPFERDQIDHLVSKAVKTRRLAGPSAEPSYELVPAAATPEASSGEAAQPEAGGQFGMVGRSPAMVTVKSMIGTVAASPSTVLITGESGTGKELVARALHMGSERKDKPFIRVNCAAIPAGLVESELFGHERGAFTGAVSSRQGRFELADGGTLFLDEVSEIPLEIQVKLLRAIQESEFERVGGVKTLRVDVRLIAATNRNLEDEIKDKRFREDLYYRLNVVPIHLPPLRERPEDVEPLLQHFLERSNERLGKAVTGFTPEALEALKAYSWPGNIRELENLVERMVLFASGDRVSVDELPDSFTADGEDEDGDDAGAEGEVGLPRAIRLPLDSLGLDLKEAVKAGSRRIEEALIREALAQTDANVTRSARKLGISRRSLQSKMKELGLREEIAKQGGVSPTPPTEE